MCAFDRSPKQPLPRPKQAVRISQQRRTIAPNVETMVPYTSQGTFSEKNFVVQYGHK